MIPNPDENEDFTYHPSAFELDPDLWSDEKIFESDSSEEVIKLRKELEVYKKALVKACEDHYWRSSTESLMNDYINEAREELKKARGKNDT